MGENLHDEELLTRFLNNEMSMEERNEFTSLLENDASLRQRLERMQLTIEAVKLAGTGERVKGIHQQMMSEFRESNKPTPVRRMPRWTLSIAASIIIIFVLTGGWWFYQLSPEDVYTDHYVPFSLGNNRGTVEPDAPLSVLYKNRSYGEVIRRSSAGGLSAYDSLLVALSFLETNQAGEAIQWLTALHNGHGPYKADADYYLSMAYLKNKEYDKSLQLAQQINQNKNHLYYQQASGRLLRELQFLQWK